MRSLRKPNPAAAHLHRVSSSVPLAPARRVTRSQARVADSAWDSISNSKSNSNPIPAPDSSEKASIPDIEDVAGPSRKRRRVTNTEPTPEASPARDNDVKEDRTSSAPASAPVPAPRKRRKPARVIKGSSAASSSATVEAPSDWEEMYSLIREMRLSGPAREAPVDTMGCDRLFAADANERDKRFHILIALMLSSQTKDTVNAVAMGRLHTELPPHAPGAAPGLTLENVLAVEPAKLNELIYAVGFHNNKTKYIKQSAEILRDKHNSDIPSTIDGLTSLPGVGPKMAHLCLSAAWDRTEGIGVDVHVHRLTNQWGWHARPTTNPEASRLALEAWLPRDKWREINTLLVGLGQTVCPPQAGSRRCGECTLGLKGLCRTADRKKVAEGRRVQAKIEVKEDVEVKMETATATTGGVTAGVVVKEETETATATTTTIKREIKKEEEE